eukprot:NODE_6_length_70510_cov_1.054395.p55 type:complete len:127 gc:universal NODE_6_length_70510_cov_1.054395:1628-1248(-)
MKFFASSNSKLRKFMKYCKDPHAIYAKYDKCTDQENKALLFLLYQFFTDLQRMATYLNLEIPHPILHLIVQYIKTDGIYIHRHTQNIHVFPYLSNLEPLVQQRLRSSTGSPTSEKNPDLRVSLNYQ